MNEVIKAIKERRSIRRFLQEQINEEDLNEILDCGLYAPNAGGRQSGIIVVSQDSEVNEKLGRLNCNSFYDNLSKNAKLGVSAEQPSIADTREIKSAFYGAPTVLTLFSVEFQYAKADCAVMAENIMLAAHSMGIGACMVGRADHTFASEYGKEILEKWGIEEGLVPQCHIALGYYECDLPHAKARKEGRIVRV